VCLVSGAESAALAVSAAVAVGVWGLGSPLVGAPVVLQEPVA